MHISDLECYRQKIFGLKDRIPTQIREWNQKDDLLKGLFSVFSHFFWIWFFRDQCWPPKYRRPHFLFFLGSVPHCSQTPLSWNHLLYTLIHSITFIEAFYTSSAILGIGNITVSQTGQNLFYHYLPPQTSLMCSPSNMEPLAFLLRAVYQFYYIYTFSHACLLKTPTIYLYAHHPLHSPPHPKTDATSGTHQYIGNSANINFFPCGELPPKFPFPLSF